MCSPRAAPIRWGGRPNAVLYRGLAISAAWSLVIYYVAIWRRLPVAKVDEYTKDVYPVQTVGH